MKIQLLEEAYAINLFSYFQKQWVEEMKRFHSPADRRLVAQNANMQNQNGEPQASHRNRESVYFS